MLPVWVCGGSADWSRRYEAGVLRYALGVIVPNYVPEPLEVPANVTLEPYARRLRFVRAVTLRHATVVAAIAGLALVPGVGAVVRFFGMWGSVGIFLGYLIAMELVRIARRGTALEARLAIAGLPGLIALAAIAGRALETTGVPVHAALVGFACAGAYTAMAGRDYSFVGNGLISLGLSTAIVAWAFPGRPVALGINALALLYHVYDLASLMSRRRVGEEWAAALDLFRDVFNIFGWALRVWRHWGRHRIWSDLPIRPSGASS